MNSQPATVAISPGPSAAVRHIPYPDVQRAIHAHLSSADYASAVFLARQLADQLPHDAWAQLVAGEALYMSQQLQPAFEYVDRALAIDPAAIPALVVRARLCISAGRTDEGLALMDRALRLAPDNARLHCVKAELLVDAGALDEAGRAYLQALAADGRETEALLGLARLPGQRVDSTVVKRAEFIIQSGQLDREAQIKGHFALAHVYEKQGQIDLQFGHLDAGNSLMRALVRYDRGAATAAAARNMEFFSADFLARHADPSASSAEPIFIVGFPRCGSTLVEQILSSHSGVMAAGETFALRHALRGVMQAHQPGGAYPQALEMLAAGAFREIAAGYLGRLDQAGLRGRVTDKMLENYRYIGLISLLFPRARIIDVRRDPIDVCFSCYKHLFSLGSLPFAYKLEDLAAEYRAYRAYMAHWDQVLPGRILTVRYEDLVSDQRPVTEALLNYCQLPWEDACLAFHRNARVVQTTSNSQVRQPLYRDAVGRWQACASRLGPLLGLADE